MNGDLTAPGKQHRDRLIHLRKQREGILSLPAEKALARILEEKHPAALVHSFPEEDFYFLMHDIGMGDALPLLGLASDRQREYLLDMEGWDHDRLQPHAMTTWLDAMLMADPNRVTTWLLKGQTELMELLLFRNIQVVLREHDQDPSVFGDDFFTFDDVYYIRILDDPKLSIQEGSSKEADGRVRDEQRRGFYYRLLARLADLDHVAYQKLLLEALNIMPAEVEEEIYRLRNVRMAEKGFLPFEEAVGIYQPDDPIDIKTQPVKSFGREEDDSKEEPLPLYPVRMLHGGTPFSDALQEVDSTVLLQRIQLEFVTLCNQIISADQKKIQSRAALQHIVEKACGYLNIGLETNLEDDATFTGSKAAAMAKLVQRLPLSRIFRSGYGRALALKWQAQRWLNDAWFETAGLPLTFWGETWLGVLGGLMLEKPLYFDNYETGQTLYREFGSLQDIETTEQVFSTIQKTDALLGDMSISCRPDEKHLLTWQNLILTLWARHHLGLDMSEELDAQGRLSPLSKTEFRTFFEELFSKKDMDEKVSSGTTGKMMKTGFLGWVSKRSGRAPEEITTKLGPVLDALFEQVDEELGQVRPDSIDPRFIQLFRIDP